MLGIYKFGRSGRTIVFLPGGNIDARCYFPLLKKLAEKNTVYAINYPFLNTKTLEETIDFVLDFIINLKQRNIIIIGHSFGGAIADILSSRSDNISKSILINPAILKTTDSTGQIIIKMVYKILNNIFKHPGLIIYNFKLFFFTITNLIFHTKGLISHIKQALNHIGNPSKLIKGNDKNIFLWSNNDELFPLELIPNEIKEKTLIVDGNHDWIMNDIDKSSAIIQNIIDG